jgi:hypothetical protein
MQYKQNGTIREKDGWKIWSFLVTVALSCNDQINLKCSCRDTRNENFDWCFQIWPVV